MRIGVAYYPEQWPEDRWPLDARMMREAGIQVVRLAEFAWSRLEPRRGQYDTDWLQRAVEVLAGEGLKVILCTPSATPPTWLFNRHPHILPQDYEGNRWYLGSRRHVCLNNSTYRRYVRRVVRELARSFGSDQSVCAWQIDNEIGCHASGHCYCDDCEQAFREWLKKRYGTIERLNRLWNNAFWSQEVYDWTFVPAPRRTPAGVHPSLGLDYERFTSATARDFVQMQREIIEDYSTHETPIMTNCMGLSTPQINQFALGSVQDVAVCDNYPANADDPHGSALMLDLTRSVKGREFWVAEQRVGASMIDMALGAESSQPRPGKLRLWTYQAAARGADLIEYFRWRTARAGQEMHWYGILDADGSLPRRYHELVETIAEVQEKAHNWHGRLPDAPAAMILDYDSMWALQADDMSAGLDWREHFHLLYSVLRIMGLAVDILPPDRDLSGYALAVAPMPVICDQHTAAAWGAYVQNGGWMLVTAPAGYRTRQNTWPASRPPGPLNLLIGAEVTEEDVIGKHADSTIRLEGESYPAGSFCTVLDVKGAEVLGCYEDRHYAGTAAVTRNPVGEGGIYYVGSVAGRELYREVLRRLAHESGLQRHPWSSATVEVIPLQVAEGQPSRTFVLNHGSAPVELALPSEKPAVDLLSGREFTSHVQLGPDDVVLLEH